MQNRKDSTSEHPKKDEGGLVHGLITLALPLLSFQRDVIHSVKTSLETHKNEHINAVGKLLSLELHAMMMLLDPTRKLRGRFDDGLEEDLNKELTKILENLASGLITIVEVQDKILPRLIDALKEAKNGAPQSAKRNH